MTGNNCERQNERPGKKECKRSLPTLKKGSLRTLKLCCAANAEILVVLATVIQQKGALLLVELALTCGSNTIQTCRIDGQTLWHLHYFLARRTEIHSELHNRIFDTFEERLSTERH